MANVGLGGRGIKKKTEKGKNVKEKGRWGI
jgi:hypothetical protein